MPKQQHFYFPQYQTMIEDARDIKTIVAIIVLSCGSLKQKDINTIQFATVLELCAHQIKVNYLQGV